MSEADENVNRVVKRRRKIFFPAWHFIKWKSHRHNQLAKRRWNTRRKRRREKKPKGISIIELII